MREEMASAWASVRRETTACPLPECFSLSVRITQASVDRAKAMTRRHSSRHRGAHAFEPQAPIAQDPVDRSFG